MTHLHFHAPATVTLAKLANQLLYLQTYVLPHAKNSRFKLSLELAPDYGPQRPGAVVPLLLRLAEQRLGAFDEALVQAAIAEVRVQMARVGPELLQEYRDACAFAGVDPFTSQPLGEVQP